MHFSILYHLRSQYRSKVEQSSAHRTCGISPQPRHAPCAVTRLYDTKFDIMHCTAQTLLPPTPAAPAHTLASVHAAGTLGQAVHLCVRAAPAGDRSVRTFRRTWRRSSFVVCAPSLCAEFVRQYALHERQPNSVAKQPPKGHDAVEVSETKDLDELVDLVL